MQSHSLLSTLAPRLERIGKTYRRLFSVHEIEESRVLQWMFGASVLYFFVTFFRWIGSELYTVEAAQAGRAACWPYFQSCGDYLFFHPLTVSYVQTTVFMVLYGIMALAIWCMAKRKWGWAHALLMVLFFSETLFLFLFAYLFAGSFNYYHLFLTAPLLFAPHKEYFLKLLFVLFYFLSAPVKFDDTWMAGTYFSALKTGLPFAPAVLIPFLTNFVIFLQVVVAWFLLSKKWLLQRIALTFFIVFHLYSGVLVYYTFPTAALPPLLILFGSLYQYTPAPYSKKSIAGWFIVLVFLIFCMPGYLISSDRRLSAEGNRFGMFMFEANHQCVITATSYVDRAPGRLTNWETPTGTRCYDFFCKVRHTEYYENGMLVRQERFESGSSGSRCDPYQWWFLYKKQCANDRLIRNVSLTFDHSINGGPFYRMVNEQNICEKEYKAFSHNEWIQLPPDAAIVGYPVQNYHDDP